MGYGFTLRRATDRRWIGSVGVTSVGVTLVVALALAGCGSAGETLLSYIGGGLPPGEPDIGGVVLSAVDTASVSTAQQETVPVVGAGVQLLRGTRIVGQATTGEGGYFRFERPGSGQYEVVVTPPQGSELNQARRQFRHTEGRQTYLTIVLEPLEG